MTTYILIAMILGSTSVTHINGIGLFNDKPACMDAAEKINKVIEMKNGHQLFFVICAPTSTKPSN